jgi:glycosyltransferase involved in cell wall biosynthesis
MKIGFLVPDSLTTRGGTKRVCEYAMRLGKRGHDVYILTPDKVLPDWLVGYYDGFKLFDIDKYRSFKADVAVATGAKAGRRLSRMDHIKVKAFSVVLLESLTKPTEKHGQIIDRDRFLRDPYEQGWIYYANSVWMKDIVETKFGQKCHLVIAPTNERMKPSPPIYKSEGKLIVCGFGGNSNWKGGARTAEAAVIAQKTLPNLEMIHYAKRSKPRLPIIVKHWSEPKQDLLPRIYSSADVFIHSSRWEGWSNTCAEALACGVPVISYKTSGIESLVIHNETGIIVDNFDVNDMARAIVDLLTNRELYNKIRVNTTKHMSQFTWEKTLTSLETIFVEALHGCCTK